VPEHYITLREENIDGRIRDEKNGERVVTVQVARQSDKFLPQKTGGDGTLVECDKHD